MIFVTVGSMLPFDRFIRVMDDWAARSGEQVFAQIGGGDYIPRMPHARMLTPGQFANHVAKADLIVAHAGMGSVIMAAEAGKPIVLFPRRAALGEHTTDHQLHTVGWLKDRPGIFVAMDETALGATIERARSAAPGSQSMPTTAPADFVENVRRALLS